MFGDPVIESADDDLGLVEELQDAGEDIFATIRQGEEGKFGFEVCQNETGESVVSSDDVFEDANSARRYLTPFVKEIEVLWAPGS
jgi:hypothetical protein